jgi:FixJ family two-component response regulator
MASKPEPTIYLVDDDPTVRTSIGWLLEAAGYHVIPCVSAEELLDKHPRDAHGCILLDCQLPGLSGVDLIRRHVGKDIEVPVVVLTGQSDLRVAVQAMREGAQDYLPKPAHPGHLLDVVERAVKSDAASWWARRERDDLSRRLATLTQREREVLEQLMKGFTNRDAGTALGISPRTVEVHRSNIMDKMMADSMVDLACRLGRHALAA